MKKNDDLDFTQQDIDTIQAADPSGDKQLAKEMGTTPGSIRAMRRYLGSPYKQAAAKPALKTVDLSELTNKMLISCNGTTIMVDKKKVSAVTIMGTDITIHNME